MPLLRWLRTVASVGWLVVAAVVFVAAPIAVLAATPTGIAGDEIPIPEGNFVEPLIGIVTALVGIAGAIGIVIMLGTVLAGIGPRVGQPGSIPGAAAAGTPPPTAAWRQRWFLAIASVSLAIGILTGRSIAYSGSLGGFSAIGAAVLVFLLGAAVVGLVVIGLVAIRIRHGHVSRAIANVLAAAGLLVTGAVGGAATAAATGGLYHVPVVLQAPGEMTIHLEAVQPAFVARNAGTAECQSDPDGRTVVGVTALDLGELGPGTMRAMLSLPITPAEPATAEFFIDAGDLPEGSLPPSWSGQVLVSGMSDDHATGRLAFDGLQLQISEKVPEAQSSAAIAVQKAWPAVISGELSWSCQPW